MKIILNHIETEQQAATALRIVKQAVKVGLKEGRGNSKLYSNSIGFFLVYKNKNSYSVYFQEPSDDRSNE